MYVALKFEVWSSIIKHLHINVHSGCQIKSSLHNINVCDWLNPYSLGYVTLATSSVDWNIVFGKRLSPKIDSQTNSSGENISTCYLGLLPQQQKGWLVLKEFWLFFFFSFFPAMLGWWYWSGSEWQSRRLFPYRDGCWSHPQVWREVCRYGLPAVVITLSLGSALLTNLAFILSNGQQPITTLVLPHS